MSESLSESLIQATIESRFDNVWLIGAMVRAIATQVGFSSLSSIELELAIVEALNNSIEHSYEGRSGHKVEFFLQWTSGALEFTIADHGLPIPEGRGLPDAEQSSSTEIPDLSEGGRGIAIIRQVMDKVDYRRSGDRNELCLSKRLVA